MRIVLTCLFALLFTGLNFSQATAQNYRDDQSRVRVSPRPRASSERFRVKTRMRQDVPQSGYDQAGYDQGTYQAPTQGAYSESAPSNFQNDQQYFDQGSVYGNHQPGEQSRASFASRYPDSTTKFWGDGYYPNIRGDLFGYSRHACCDEWLGHCDCLELTSTASNCECTNPHRAHWANAGGCSNGNCDGSCGGGCGGEFERAGYSSRRPLRSRRSVSQYFHPRDYE